MGRILFAFALALLLGPASPAADPPRPDPKLYSEKWEKGGVTVAVEEARAQVDGVGVFVRVTNESKGTLTLKGLLFDEVYAKTGKADPKSPLLGVELADGYGAVKPAVLRSVALKGVKGRGAGDLELKPGETAVVTLGFDRPAVAERYYLTVPAAAVGLPAAVRLTVPAAKFASDLSDK